MQKSTKWIVCSLTLLAILLAITLSWRSSQELRWRQEYIEARGTFCLEDTEKDNDSRIFVSGYEWQTLSDSERRRRIVSITVVNDEQADLLTEHDRFLEGIEYVSVRGEISVAARTNLYRYLQRNRVRIPYLAIDCTTQQTFGLELLDQTDCWNLDLGQLRSGDIDLSSLKRWNAIASIQLTAASFDSSKDPGPPSFILNAQTVADLARMPKLGMLVLQGIGLPEGARSKLKCMVIQH